MKSIKTRETIKMLAKEYGLSMDDIRKVVESPFFFTKHVLENKTDRSKYHFPSIRIPYFGIFFCPDSLKKKFKKKNDEFISGEGL